MKPTMLTFTLTTMAAALPAGPVFMKLGDLPGGYLYTSPTAISANGEVVVGQASGAAGFLAFRWTASGGLVSIGDLPGGPVESLAFGVSPDGSAVTGWSKVGTNDREAFVWTQTGGMQGIGDLPGGTYFSIGRGVTNGATRVIGSASNTMGWEVMYWSPGGGLVGLGDLTGDNYTSVNAVNPDCTWYAGMGRNASGTVAFVGSVGGSKTQLGELPGGAYGSTAYGISSDGKVVVGNSYSGNGTEAFSWTAAGGMRALGDLPGGTFYSAAHATSTDGSVTVGYGSGPGGMRAVMWDSTGTITDLNTVVADAGVNLEGFVLDSATGITPDGKILVGTMSNAAYDSEGWILYLQEDPDPFTPVWGDSEDSGGGWWASPWYGWFSPGYYPTMWHAEHGWQYCQASSPNSILFFDHGLRQWVWTAKTMYPFFYLYGSQPGWLFYLRGGQPGHRWFYHYGQENYFNEESL